MSNEQLKASPVAQILNHGWALMVTDVIFSELRHSLQIPIHLTSWHAAEFLVASTSTGHRLDSQ